MRRLTFAALIFTLAALALFPAAGAAQRPDAPDYAQRGPFPVGTREFTIERGDDADSLFATVWYPALNPDDLPEVVEYRQAIYSISGHALRDAAPDLDNGPYPLVAFSHGLGGVRQQSLFLTEHLASHGFVVIAVDHPGSTLFDMFTAFGGSEDHMAAAVQASFGTRPLEVLAALDFAESLTAPDGALAGLIDMERLAVSGHSFGGYTAAAVGGARLQLDDGNPWLADPIGYALPAEDETDFPQLTLARNEEQRQLSRDVALVAGLRGYDAPPQGLWDATTDPRIQAVILMAPIGVPEFGPVGITAITAPTLILTGSLDDSVPPEENAYVYYNRVGAEERGLVVFENADHYIFVESCPEFAIRFGLYERCSDPVWDMARAHDLINHYTTAFLRAVLYDDADAAAVESAFPGVRTFYTGR